MDDRVAELRASGLTDAAIARRMSISPAWFHQAMNKAKVGDGFIAKLSTAFGIPFMLPGQLSESQTPGSQPQQGAAPDLYSKVRELYDAHERILGKFERFMDRYEVVIVERDKDRAEIARLRAENDQLRAQLAGNPVAKN